MFDSAPDLSFTPVAYTFIMGSCPFVLNQYKYFSAVGTQLIWLSASNFLEDMVGHMDTEKYKTRINS